MDPFSFKFNDVPDKFINAHACRHTHPTTFFSLLKRLSHLLAMEWISSFVWDHFWNGIGYFSSMCIEDVTSMPEYPRPSYPGKLVPRGDRLRVSWLNGCSFIHESRNWSRDTYPESYITKYNSMRRELLFELICLVYLRILVYLVIYDSR